MNDHPRSRLLGVLALALLMLLALGPGLAAQEPPPPAPDEPAPVPAEDVPPPAVPPEGQTPATTAGEEPKGRMLIELAEWAAQPSGLEYNAAIETDAGDAFGDRVLALPSSGTSTSGRHRLGYRLPGTMGHVIFTYFGHTDERRLERFAPGDFIYGETLVHPLFAGFGNDGLADGFESESQTKLRDWHLDYCREAFAGRVSASWCLGWRRVRHTRDASATYFTILPTLPPLIPPFTGLQGELVPDPDSARITSAFEGRGAGGSVDLALPLWKDKIVLEGGLGLSVLRGKTDSRYTSVTNAYFLDGNVLLGPPYDEFGAVRVVEQQGGGVVIQPLVDFITQVQLPLGLRSESISTDANVLEAEIGVRWHFRPRIEFFAGFRNAHYTNVGVDLRPDDVTLLTGEDGVITLNLQEFREVDRSANYEGFFAGVTFRLF